MTHPYRKPQEKKPQPPLQGPTITCPRCRGNGDIAYGDHSLHRCPRCNGTGRISNA